MSWRCKFYEATRHAHSVIHQLRMLPHTSMQSQSLDSVRLTDGTLAVNALLKLPVDGGSTVSAAIDNVAVVVREKMGLRRAAR